MIKLDKYDSQIVLLAKGQFGKVDNHDEALKILIGHRNCLLLEHVSTESIFYALLQILEKLGLRDKLFDSHNLYRILFGCPVLERNSCLERWIDFCMGEFCNLQVLKDVNGVVPETLVWLEPVDKSLLKELE